MNELAANYQMMELTPEGVEGFAEGFLKQKRE